MRLRWTLPLLGTSDEGGTGVACHGFAHGSQQHPAHRPQTPGTHDDEVVGARFRLLQDDKARGVVYHLVALDIEPRGRQSVGCRPRDALRMGGSLNPDLLVGLQGEPREHDRHEFVPRQRLRNRENLHPTSGRIGDRLELGQRVLRGVGPIGSDQHPAALLFERGLVDHEDRNRRSMQDVVARAPEDPAARPPMAPAPHDDKPARLPVAGLDDLLPRMSAGRLGHGAESFVAELVGGRPGVGTSPDCILHDRFPKVLGGQVGRRGAEDRHAERGELDGVTPAHGLDQPLCRAGRLGAVRCENHMYRVHGRPPGGWSDYYPSPPEGSSAVPASPLGKGPLAQCGQTSSVATFLAPPRIPMAQPTERRDRDSQSTAPHPLGTPLGRLARVGGRLTILPCDILRGTLLWAG